jgi:DNA-binding SARP family transcriptional activator
LGGQRLIALLALRGATARSTVAGLLWPDSPESRALANLRTVLWRMSGLGPGLIRVEHGWLDIPSVLEVDVAQVTEWASRTLDVDTDVPSPRPSGGELLPGWSEDWVLFERERLRQLWLHALERLADQLGRRQRFGAAIDAALEAVSLDPFRESAHCTLIRLYLAEGNVAEAMRQLESFRALLRLELGLEPSPRLGALIAEHGCTRSGRVGSIPVG